MIRGQQSGRWLKLSYDRKVSPRGWRQTKARDRWVPTVPNSFGLPAGTTCPGLTGFCRSCYAARAHNSANVQELVEHNLRLLQRAGTVGAMAALLGEMMGRYDHEADRQGLDERERIFRIHWDGDFWSAGYAEAWVAALAVVPHVKAWAYTRSFVPALNVVPVLADVPNLTLYLSVDAENARYAGPVLAAHPRVLVAACAEDYRHARQLVPEGRRRAPITCPENDSVKGLPLVGDDGVGACASCRVCPDARRDIMFATSHREDAHVTAVGAPRRRPAVFHPKPGLATAPLAVEQHPPIPGLPECANPACRNSVPRGGGPGRPASYCRPQCRKLHILARRRSSRADDRDMVPDRPADKTAPRITEPAGHSTSGDGQLVVTDETLDRVVDEAITEALPA